MQVRIQSYVLFGKLAAGGMAEVYAGARQGPEGFVRHVAIKRLHRHFATDPSFVKMLIDEARLAGRISHPNVVPMLDVVRHEEELLLVMEYVRGATIAQLLHDGKVPVPIAVSVACGMLAGLHAAHEAVDDTGRRFGIIHRDISPSNVIVGVDGVARITDFGVAKADFRLQSTREGQLKGKLAYMAPEMFAGNVLVASDVYAAAVVLWEMLAGGRMFSASNEGELVYQVTLQPHVLPSHVNPDVPSELSAIVMKGLDRDLALRFATAQEMLRALEGLRLAAPQSEVAAWVIERAASAVAEQQLLFEASADEDAGGPGLVPGNGPQSAMTRVVSPVAAADQQVDVATPVVARRGRLRALFVPGALLVGVLAVGRLVVWTAASRRAADAASAGSSVPVASSKESASTEAPAQPSPSSPAEPALVLAPSSAASARIEPRPARAVVHLASSARPSSSCTPPFSIDAAGIKHFKVGCLSPE